MSDDAKRAGENAESKPLNLRLPHAVSDQLRDLADSLPIVSKHRLAVEALRLGIAALMADPSILLRGAATPAQIAPAAPAAPAPVLVVASPAAPVEPPAVAPVVPVADSRQLPLLTAAPPMALSTAADGQLSVARPIGNDNGVSPATPKPKRKMPPGVRADGSVVDLDQLRARLEAALADGQSGRSVARVAEVNDSGIVQWRNGTKGLGAVVAVKLDAALSKLGF
mgnify:CR=1 FL=1